MKLWIPSLQTGQVISVNKREKFVYLRSAFRYCSVKMRVWILNHFKIQLKKTLKKPQTHCYSMCAWCAAATEDTFAVCWQPRKAFLQWDCKKVTQTVYGWPRDGAYRMSLCHRGFLEDCLNLFVVELFIERLQTTSVTQIFNLLTFESVFHINDINSCKIIIQLCVNPE